MPQLHAWNGQTRTRDIEGKRTALKSSGSCFAFYCKHFTRFNENVTYVSAGQVDPINNPKSSHVDNANAKMTQEGCIRQYSRWLPVGRHTTLALNQSLVHTHRQQVQHWWQYTATPGQARSIEPYQCFDELRSDIPQSLNDVKYVDRIFLTHLFAHVVASDKCAAATGSSTVTKQRKAVDDLTRVKLIRLASRESGNR